MIKPRAVCVLIAVLAAASASSTAHGQDAHALWHVYFSAGANAARLKNWPEAETLYTSAVKQAEVDSPKEPFLTIAKYSLGTVYWEQGRKDEATETFNALKLLLDPATVHQEIRDSVDMLIYLGDHFYQEATDVNKDAEAKKLKDDALKASQADANQKFRFSRRYYQWAAAIDEQFYTANSPELEDVLGNVAVMNFKVGDYPEAIKTLLQLKQIVQAETQRRDALSNGSMTYSLASRNTANLNAANLKDALATNTHTVFNDTDIDIYLGFSYEDEAGEIFREKPAEAAQNLGLAEMYMTMCLNDTVYGKSAGPILARLYTEHANLLRQLKRIPEAEKLEAQAKKLPAPPK